MRKGPRIHWNVWAPLILAALTVCAVLPLSGKCRLEIANPSSAEAIATRFQDVPLTPPPPLPSSFFVAQGAPDRAGADRDWTRLDPAFLPRVLSLFRQMDRRGYPLALLEGYRSPERQDLLAKAGPQVTRARAFQSRHQLGLAVDLAPLRQGRLSMDPQDPWTQDAYRALGEEARALGMVWGGDWSFRDLGHVEWRSIPKALQETP